MNTKIKIGGKPVTVQSGLIKVAELRSKGNVKSNVQIFLDRKGDIDIPLTDENLLILRGDEKFSIGDAPSEIDDNPTTRNPVYCTINGKQITEPFKQPKVSGATLREMDKTSVSSKLFADLTGLPDALISDDGIIVLQGGEEFITIPSDAVEDDGVIDTELCAKAGSKPPKGQKGYRVKIDRHKHITLKEKITGEEILGLVNKVSAEWGLAQKFPSGKRETIKPSETVDLSAKGIERFETIPKEITQGMESVELPDEDTVYLESLGKKWEIETDSQDRMLIIYSFDLPEGYDKKSSDLMILIPSNYPFAELNMFYLFPGVQRKDDRPIPQLAQETHGGREWQRWSRHYERKEGEYYSLARHMGTVNFSLTKDATDTT